MMFVHTYTSYKMHNSLAKYTSKSLRFPHRVQ